ncbi:glutamine-hydrolyzing carbamoyl-phosphate synthase small subunit [Eubacterium xylanophilum]|uniref:glutamine-hydrolyzing carbamoyl-phosphate synthase small subunit n=1 Tax=Eubacterium xylanophilum TaxID=39497 RepID=UPI0004B92FBB
MIEKKNRKIILEDGVEFAGYGFGADCDRVTELVFNTSMVGYQEILSDPSYTDQSVVMTYPLIGNYGMNDDDYETVNPSLGGFIVREYNDEPSNFRSNKTLSEVMKEYGIPGIQGVDTRAITRSIRDLGSRKVLITDIDTSLEEGLEILKKTELPKDAVSRVSTKEIYVKEPEKYDFHVVAIDCGMKLNILRSLLKKKCKVTVVPYNTSAEKIKELKPDGIFISNGPGNPEDAVEVVETVKQLVGKYPIFGICLGHQIISLVYGAQTYKLKFGHRGGNHPVRNISNGKIEITSQNHSYAVDDKSLANTDLEATHINILDNTIEGVKCDKDNVFSVQYHPESAPGPQDSGYLFDIFIDNMKEGK